jgi:hypothetical protein
VDNNGAAAALKILVDTQTMGASQLPPGLLTQARSKVSTSPTLADAILTYEETEGRTIKSNTFEERKRWPNWNAD